MEPILPLLANFSSHHKQELLATATRDAHARSRDQRSPTTSRALATLQRRALAVLMTTVGTRRLTFQTLGAWLSEFENQIDMEEA